MSLLNSILGNTVSGSQSQGGSRSIAGGSNWGYNTAQSINRSQSSGYSNTAGNAASDKAANAAAVANAYSMKNMDKVMKYNSMEAQKQRDWEERMANTIYTRSIANMKEAGINPILAAGMGLSGASVGSGATASVAQPQTFMGQTFAEQNSAQQSWSTGDSFSKGESGGSWGSSSSSWNKSESGLATGLKQMATLSEGILDSLTTGKRLEDLQNTLSKLGNNMQENAKNAKDNTRAQQQYADDGNLGMYFISKFKDYMRDNGMSGLLGMLPFPNLDNVNELEHDIKKYKK